MEAPERVGTMFNETSFLGEACEAAKAECEQRFPVDTFDPSVDMGKQIHLHLACLDAFKCGGSSQGYDNPGATTYPVDVITNPDNPNTVWQWPGFVKDIAASLGISETALVGVGAALLFAFGFMKK